MNMLDGTNARAIQCSIVATDGLPASAVTSATGKLLGPFFAGAARVIAWLGSAFFLRQRLAPFKATATGFSAISSGPLSVASPSSPLAGSASSGDSPELFLSGPSLEDGLSPNDSPEAGFSVI